VWGNAKERKEKERRRKRKKKKESKNKKYMANRASNKRAKKQKSGIPAGIRLVIFFSPSGGMMLRSLSVLEKAMPNPKKAAQSASFQPTPQTTPSHRSPAFFGG
jgi:hypothetical protein